jgi:hypothetical protein
VVGKGKITFKLQNPLENMFGRDQRKAEEIVRKYAIGRGGKELKNA